MWRILNYDNSDLNKLKNQKEELKKEIKSLNLKDSGKYILPILSILYGTFFSYIKPNDSIEKYLFNIIGTLFIILGIILGAILLFIKNPKIMVKEEQVLEINDEIELLEILKKFDKRNTEIYAEIRFRKYEKEMKRYHDINLISFKILLPIGITIIFFGIGIIIGSIILFFVEKDKLSIIIGPISGILTNFVGAIFIKMYTETVKSSLKFHNKLVNSSSKFFSNVLISKIKNQDLQDKTLSEVAKIISKGDDGFKENENS